MVYLLVNVCLDLILDLERFFCKTLSRRKMTEIPNHSWLSSVTLVWPFAVLFFFYAYH